jgi:hypothetical protein
MLMREHVAGVKSSLLKSLESSSLRAPDRG